MSNGKKSYVFAVTVDAGRSGAVTWHFVATSFGEAEKKAIDAGMSSGGILAIRRLGEVKGN